MTIPTLPFDIGGELKILIIMLELTKQTEKICECVFGKNYNSVPSWLWLLKVEERVKIPLFLYFLYREAGNGVKDSIELTKEDISSLTLPNHRNWILEKYILELRMKNQETGI